MKYSSGIIKPDGVKRNLQSEIFGWMELVGIKVIFQKLIVLGKKDVRILYNYCSEMDHYNNLEDFMVSGPVMFYIVFSEKDTIESLNRLVGPTNPKSSIKETIRGKYGETVARNVIHSTQNSSTFKTEVEHFLTKREILSIFL